MIAAKQTTPRRTLPSACLAAMEGGMEAPSRRRLEPASRAVTVAGALVLHYRPRLCLATGEIVASEALVRWSGCEQGLASPSPSTPVAERSDLMRLIPAWVLAEACREAACWNAARLSVSVLAWQLQSGVLPIQLAAALEQSGLPPDRLELGLTGSLLADSSADTLLALSAIRDQGIGLALDAFGTGSASMATLKRLPLTAMKLDRSLARELPMSREDAATVRAMIEAGRSMGLTTVAEGVETEAQRAFLSGIGCDEGQGDLFSHPLPAWQLRLKLGLARF